MSKNCLTCKYEPDWGSWGGVVYKKRIGVCQCPVVIPPLPSVYTIHKKSITCYSDNSGIEISCKTWEKK